LRVKGSVSQVREQIRYKGGSGIVAANMKRETADQVLAAEAELDRERGSVKSSPGRVGEVGRWSNAPDLLDERRSSAKRRWLEVIRDIANCSGVAWKILNEDVPAHGTLPNGSRLSCGALKKDSFRKSTRAASFKRLLGRR
jgi:hypothetical protein